VGAEPRLGVAVEVDYARLAALGTALHHIGAFPGDPDHHTANHQDPVTAAHRDGR
jgi:hypothetical protein